MGVIGVRNREDITMRAGIREAFEVEWRAAMGARHAGDLNAATHHLERAHVLGQRMTALHVRSHWGMFALAWQRRDGRALIGQASRLLAASLFTWLWVPEGNTGGTNVSAFRKMPIPEDLRKTLYADSDTR
jgi:hypothetical protein